VNIRLLKTLVVVMGIMLVVGMFVLVGVVGARLSHRGAPPPGAAFTAPPVALPKGAKIEAMSTGPDRIVADVLLSDGTRELLVIDLQSGRLLGTISLREE
jgi:hypothetical protein